MWDTYEAILNIVSALIHSQENSHFADVFIMWLWVLNNNVLAFSIIEILLDLCRFLVFGHILNKFEVKAL